MDSKIKPDQFLIIIGSAKCGTTSLFSYLSEHPQICPSLLKEPEYFTQYEKHQRAGQKVRRSIHAYDDFWPNFDPGVHRYALEGSTGYTKWPSEQGVAQRMHAYGMKPRLIFIVRDPIERIESHENFRRVHWGPRITSRDDYFVNISRYAKQIDPFVEFFGREAIRVVNFAHLRDNPNSVCADLYCWLELEHREILNPRIANVTANVKTSRLDHLVQNSRALRVIAHLSPPRFRKQVRKAGLRLAPYRYTYAQLSPDRAREIRETLREDVDRLSREWGVDVTTWGFDASV